MKLRLAALIVCASATGCRPGPTTIALTIGASPGVTVRSLTLHLALGSADAGVSEALPPSGTMPTLPGRAVVRLADVAMDVAVALDGWDVDGAALHAGTVVRTVPHGEVAASLTLGVLAVDLGASDLGGDGGAPCVLGARCSYAYRRQLTIHNSASSTLPSGYTVRVPIDPLLLVATKTRVDLNDVRVFDDPTATELERVIDLTPPGQTRALWIALAHPIAAGASDTRYSIYYGDPNAAPPPSDATQVFPFWDSFDNGSQLSSFWLSNGAPTVGSSVLTLHMNSQDAVTTNAATDKIPALSALEWRSRITNPASAGQVTSNGTFWSWVGYQHTGDFSPSEPFIVWIVSSPTDVHGERQIAGGACASICNAPQVTPDSAFHSYRIERDPTTTRFYIDGVPSGAAIADPNTVDYSVMIRNYAVASDLVVQWIRARALASPEPTVTLGAELVP